MSELVVLSDAGLYCPAGDFHIDPSRKVARAVVTHAHADHARPGMGQYWAARAGAGLLKIRLGRDAPLSSLAYGERTRIGAATVSLHPAGHVLGSAQVRIEVDGAAWVVSGDYKRCPDPSCAPFEPVACDTFVTEATFAQPHFQWQPPAVVVADILRWWQQCKTEGKAAVLFAYALGKAQRILAELAAHSDETVLLHAAMTPLVKAYRQAGVRMLPTEPVGDRPKGTSFAGRLVLAPPGAGGTPWMRRFAPYDTGFASGWMQLEGTRRRAAYQRGFALSDHSDWPGLIRSIEESGARRVLAMHGQTQTLIDYLRGRGIEAAPLQAVGDHAPATSA
ncbi:MAG: ligase-associated DNA damage response exonuclease [Stagnimonas sp.]|nr:ligase-associated DNA damage response exonuclease [Stagnimonas sp.]